LLLPSALVVQYSVEAGAKAIGSQAKTIRDGDKGQELQ
jgi:hypothetical protein